MLTLAYSYMRFSSLEQGKGNSSQRQNEKRDQYLARRGLTLDWSLVLVGLDRSRARNSGCMFGEP